MTERPIIFSTPMVRAILDGRKTQFRWVVKNMPPQPTGAYFDAYNKSEFWNWWTKENKCCLPQIKCPHGAPSDRLWVRETFCLDFCDHVIYKADGGSAIDAGYSSEPNWKPSIHMPRHASRITLEVISVRVERVQDITGSDACAEGIQFRHVNSGAPLQGPLYKENIQQFSQLWDSINAKRGYGWDKNPWVWVVEFKQV